MKAIVAALLVLALAGCQGLTLSDTTRATVATEGARVADHALGDAAWFICYAATVGSIRRAYGESQEAWLAYNELCEVSAVAMKKLPTVSQE